MEYLKLKNRELEILKKIQLEILDYIVSVCNKYNLKYFLIGGSCLGAVRHNGYIPWDDDIDIGLFRTDYDKLLSILYNEIDDKYIIQNSKTEKKFPYLFSKIIKKNTVFLQDNLKKLKMTSGIFIDIFPIDALPNDYENAKKHMSKIMLLNYMHMSKVLKMEKGKLKYNLTLVMLKALRVIFTKKRIEKKLEKSLLSYSIDDTNLIGNLIGRAKMREIMEKEIYIVNGVLSSCDFENNKYFIPNDYDKYLKKLFNNYMEYPPLEERKSHHQLIQFYAKID